MLKTVLKAVLSQGRLMQPKVPRDKLMQLLSKGGHDSVEQTSRGKA